MGKRGEIVKGELASFTHFPYCPFPPGEMVRNLSHSVHWTLDQMRGLS
jgi:hypothetical protein